MPVTSPEAEPTVATAGSLLLHVPPDVVSINEIEDPVHKLSGPEIVDVDGLTVTGAELTQPKEFV